MIELKNAKEIEAIRKSARIAAQVLESLRAAIKPGMPAIELDAIARKESKRLKARPAFLNYRGFPAAVCVSINAEVVHGIPSKDRIIKEGDIVSVDFGTEVDGFFGDSAITVAAGRISEKAGKLMDVTQKALMLGIEQARPGNRLHDISAAVQAHAEANGFSVVRDYVGHGIGRKLHEDPMVPNYGKAGTGPVLEAGTVIAIEPMVNEKGYEVKVLENDWTVVTLDGGLSAHFEHTVAITENGPEILSKL
jgi:methionyl aminopeptidase